MTDIVERLRDHDRHVRGRLIEGLPDLCIDDMIEAADEIERLRLALHYYANKSHWHVKYGHTYILVDEGQIARAALGEEK